MSFRKKKIACPIYLMRLIFIDTDDLSKLKKYEDTSDLIGRDIYAHTFESTISEKNYDVECVIIVFNTKSTYGKITLGTIAHEAFHAAGFILHKLGITADHVNDEAKAYLIDFIATEIHKFLNIKV